MKFIIKFLFHRVVLISVAIFIQVLLLISVILRFNNYFAFFYGGSILVSIITVLWIINKKGNPAYKMAWIIPILLFPVFGGLFYIFFGANKLSQRERRRMKSMGDKFREASVPRPITLDEIRGYNETAANQSQYIQNYAYCPPYGNTIAEYLPIGEIKYERLKEELRKAKRYIFMEYFIIEAGTMWDSILDILADKAAAGVDVRVIYDDLGTLLTLPYGYDKKLEAMGMKCCVFNPVIPILSVRLQNRDHRKITVIDGTTGFTGGINLADEYINEIEKYGHWKDAAVMLKGEAVWSLAVMFLTMWDYLRGMAEDFERFKGEPISPDDLKDTRGYVQPFTDNPFDDEPVGEIVYLNIISKAQRYVYITTPYLIIDNEMVTALTSAAKGGVDIRIITPHYADKWFVHEVTRSYYRILIESGIKIYEYLPGFIHSKTYIADDEYGVVGTINMDYRSLNLHFECGVWMYNSSSIIEMKEDYLNTLQMCKQITLEEMDSIKWYRKLVQLVLRIFAPLM